MPKSCIKSTSDKPGSGFIRNLFEETFKKHGLLNTTDSINILSDGGSENKGTFIDWINQITAPSVVRKLTARTLRLRTGREEFPHSNSMAESTHSIYKSEYLRGKYSVDVKQHFKDLETFIAYYNYNRFPFEFYGLTPMEVLKGEKPDKTKFREQINQGQKRRLEENRAFNECPLVCI